MIFKVKLSRLLRKRPLDVNYLQRPNPASIPYSRTLINAVLQTGNPSLVVGYFVVFSYSALLAPSTLLAAVFVASIASLLSELCRYEFLTCRRNTSACPYICTYQIMGEFAAHLYGWTQVLSRAAVAALVARGIGSVLVLVFGKHLLQHNFYFVNEDSFGIIAQLIVSLFVLLGLKMTAPFAVAIKLFIVMAILLFMSQIASFTVPEIDTQHHHPPSTDESSTEELLIAAGLLSMTFKPENKETHILSKSSLMSAFLGIQYCSTLFIFVIMSILHCFLPPNILNHIKSGSPLLEVLMSLATGPHWSTAIFSCCCILVGSLSLVEGIQDSKRQINKMSSDGLIWKQLATNAKWPLIVHCVISIGLQMTISTLNLVFILAFVHLGLDSILGVVVTFRRYCSYSTSRHLAALQGYKNGTSKKRHLLRRGGYDVVDPSPVEQSRAEESDSDETDIDAAVDDYKTQMYVATVMEWNGSEVSNTPERSEVGGSRTSVRVPYLLLAVSITIVVMSVAMRWILSDLNWFSVSITASSFVIYNVLLFIIWTHPQRLTSSNPTLKVPCVPWIPIGSTLFHSIMLFQLPALAWIVSLVWILSGITTYFGYSYRTSRLNFKLQDSSSDGGGKPGDLSSRKKNNPAHKLRILPETMINLNVTSSSIAVYPQPYYKI
ncbi:cationic amino acid transporter 2-like isoform X1 [Daphnia carinata]|uniref:cationic amino acid transporter 2-like isoform X1 n=2 Tax=Daphnia carinata TaxID=120202 RepID=UPI00257CD0B6|nr:cationic amino acid transporter 2-like isoform X1 [Daphnia carinata]